MACVNNKFCLGSLKIPTATIKAVKTNISLGLKLNLKDFFSLTKRLLHKLFDIHENIKVFSSSKIIFIVFILNFKNNRKIR